MVVKTVIKTIRQSGLKIDRILSALEIGKGTYYRMRREPGNNLSLSLHPDRILKEETELVIAYALANPDIRHRELAYRMIDDNVVSLSPSTVYKILEQAGLINKWDNFKKRIKRRRMEIKGPDEKWQSDIMYIKIGRKSYYLIVFIDEYSRYIVHHEIMTSMDEHSVSFAAERAFNKITSGKTPVIQTDNGGSYRSREFKIVLNERGIGHHRIRPHCPEENGKVERVIRTIRANYEDYEIGHTGKQLKLWIKLSAVTIMSGFTAQ